VAALLHEVWIDVDEETGESLTSLLHAGPGGYEARALLHEAPLAHTFYAGSHFEAMSLYREFLGEGPYTAEHPQDHEPYPDSWLEEQLSRPD
jgi:hypothetical protein